jgi:parallel beta-helix repeat protein
MSMDRRVRTGLVVGFLTYFVGLLAVVFASASHGGIRGDVATEPIYIFGDAGFANAPAVVGGTGTAADPYLIEGWTISTPEADYGIYIDHTASHFVIRDCTVEHTRSIGIYLNSVTNGRIEACILRRNGVGIYLLHSSDNVLKGNRIVENDYGLVMAAHSCRNVGTDNLWEENGLDVLDRGRDNRFGLSAEEGPPSAETEETPASAAVVQTVSVTVEREEEPVEEISPPSIEALPLPAEAALQTAPCVLSPDAELETVQTPSETLYLPCIQTASEIVTPAAVQTGSGGASE